MDLIDKLAEIKGEKSQETFAAEVGLDQSTISLLLGRKMPLGRKAARRIAARYPELALELASFLLFADMPEDPSTAA
jgi:hypothetical protein